MESMITAIDGFILSFFTKISHKFYRLTGLTNFFLAKISLYIIMASSMSIIVGFWFPVLSHKPHTFLVAESAFLCLGLLYLIHWCDKANDAIFSSNRVDFFPFINSLIFRFPWIILFMADIPDCIDNIFLEHKGIFIFRILYIMLIPAGLSFHYFIAVDPPTPGKSKVREWIESFSAGFLKPALVPVKN